MSVRCTGLGVRLLANFRRGPGRVRCSIRCNDSCFSERFFELALNTSTSSSSESDLAHIPCGVYSCALAAGGLIQGNACRLSRVKTVVSYSYIVVAQTQSVSETRISGV